MQLYEKGYFHLADPVSKFLPEFKNQSVYISGIYPAFEDQTSEQRNDHPRFINPYLVSAIQLILKIT